MAQLTVTPERQELVDFTNPTRTNVNEVVVTGPGAPAIASLDDLSGKKVFVRKGSSLFRQPACTDHSLQAKGKPPVDIQEAPDNLEDDDLLEMVNAGLIPATVVDDYLARLLEAGLHRPDRPRRRARSRPAATWRSPFARTARSSPRNSTRSSPGMASSSAFGSMLKKRYLESTKFVEERHIGSRAEEVPVAGRRSSASTARQYQFDYLLMAAQGYQESRLDQNAKSQVGAVGVMQVMPATGKELKVGDITQIEPNIHAGVKYMRFMIDQYFKDEPMDDLNKGLFTFASYNAGPGRIAAASARGGTARPRSRTSGSATSSSSRRNASAARP